MKSGMHVTFDGRLSNDHQGIAYLDNGTKRLSFGVIVHEDRTPAGQVPQLIGVTIWSDNAEHYAAILKKGVAVSLTGTLRLNKWTTNGKPFTGLNLSASSITVEEKTP